MVYSLGHKIKNLFQNFHASYAWRIIVGSYMVAIVGGLTWFVYDQFLAQKYLLTEIEASQKQIEELSEIAKQYELLKSDDQVVKNASLSAEIDSIHKTYQDGAKMFEERADLSIVGSKVAVIDRELARFLGLLSDKKWEQADEQAKKVRAEIEKVVIANTPRLTAVQSGGQANASNTLPNSGYARQKVTTERGEFVVSMVVAPGARVVIETASDSDCSDNCPTKSLAEHVSASGGFAGINGAYFCPPDYPQCQGKVNSFDTLAVNGRSKAVLNRANNVYSTVPLVAAYGSSLSFYDQTVQWGADASGGGGLANYPRLLRDGNVATEQDNGKGTRGFIGTKDGAIVIGHIYSASFADAAVTLKTLGLQNALNLDGGGSSALWADGGYKVGPGRSLPTAIILVR